MNKMIKNTCILTVITLVAGCLLGLVYEVTKAPIAKAKEADKQAGIPGSASRRRIPSKHMQNLTNRQLLLSFRMQDMTQISQK